MEGVGTLTALTFVLTLEDPYRFEKSRAVGAYLGLVPARDQSGDRDPQKHISKEGDEMLRKLLVGSAHYVLGPFGSDSDLRRHGEKIASRGGKNAKKRAVVAVARKLAVLLHTCGLPERPTNRSTTRIDAQSGRPLREKRWEQRRREKLRGGDVPDAAATILKWHGRARLLLPDRFGSNGVTAPLRTWSTLYEERDR